jgi:RsiW-degrading membrane proteinase PrsW (M82 family)
MSSWTFKEFNHILDGVVYGVTISLGFATIENIWYGYQFSTAYGSMQIILLNISLRAVTAVPAHAILGGVMGYYLGKAKVRNSGAYAFGGLLLAIFLHGLYNVFAIGIQLFPFIIEDGIIGYLIGWAGVIIFLLIGFPGLMSLIKKARREDQTIP